MRALQIASPDARCESVLRRICECDHFLFTIERSDRHDRTENLFLQNAAIAIEARDDCRLDEESFAINPPPARGNRAALFLREVDVAHHFFEMCGADQRTDVLTDAEIFREPHEALDKFVVRRSFNENPRTAQTNLALIPECR